MDRNDISLIDWENLLLKEDECKDLIFPRVNFLGVVLDNWLYASIKDYKIGGSRM